MAKTLILTEEQKAKRREYAKQWQKANRARVAAGSKKWRELHPEQYKDVLRRCDQKRQLKRRLWKYGLSIEQYNAILAACGNKCPICLEPFTGEDLNHTPHIDHCHTTGFIRGIKCRGCNLAEGLLKNPENALRLYKDMLKNELFYSNN